MENQQNAQTGQAPAVQEDSQIELPPAAASEDQEEPQTALTTASPVRQQRGTDAADILVGSAGREWLVGGKGNDIYIVSDEDTFVLERQGEGQDTIRSSVNFKLSKYVERLELMGDADLYGAGNTGNDRLIGNAGNNVLNGFKGDDSIDGGAGDDVLNGYRGSDRLVGGLGNDHLDGGFGNDVLIGGHGNDTYVLRRAMGQDYIYDEDASAGNVDTIDVTTALKPEDIDVMRDGDDLLLRIRLTTTGVRVGNWFKAPQFRIEQVRFDDGMVWDAAALDAMAAQHQALSDDLRFGQGWGASVTRPPDPGAQVTDSIFGYGTPLQDTMVMKRDGLINMLLTAPLWTQHVDMIKIDATIDAADLKLMRDHDDLILLVLRGGQSSFLRVRHGFDRARIEFADGTVWSNARIRENLTPQLRGGHFVERGVLEQSITGGGLYGYDDSHDVLDGSRDSDWIFGFGGDDILNGNDGRDSLYGGAGNDRMAGGQHADIMHGGAGSDFMDGGRGDDYMDGGASNDILVGGSGNDVIEGGSGDDLVEGGGGNDVLSGGLGDDMIRGGTGNDLLYGGAGADTYFLEVGMGSDVIDEGSGPERGSNSIEVMSDLLPADLTLVRNGQDLQLGCNDMQDQLTLKKLFDGGQAYIASVNFGDGSNWSFQELERRSIVGAATAGVDILHGKGGAQWWEGDPLCADIHDGLNGMGGADQLWGYAGNDLLDGGAGDDLIVGGAGSDLMAGSAGNDRLVRGRQSDVIVFNRGDGRDTIAFDEGSATSANPAGLAEVGRGPTLSLSGVRGDQLALRKSGADLVLEMESGDSISFENWYSTDTAVQGTQLQLVQDSTDDYQVDADDTVRRHRIALYDFNSMADQYNRARDELPGLDLWSVAAALTHHHLRGSDTMAIGGALAYHYAHSGRWDPVAPARMSAVLINPLFGNSDQAIARQVASTVLAAG